MVGSETKDDLARVSCDQPSSARAALICLIDTFSVDSVFAFDTFSIEVSLIGSFSGVATMPRQKTGSEPAQPSKVSRRTLIAGSPAAALALSQGAGASPPSQLRSFEQISAPDPVALAEAWLAFNKEVNKLTYHWQNIETQMMSDPAWATLSREERQLHPAQDQLTEIDGRKDGLVDRKHDLLERLVLAPTKDVSGAVGKLSVVMGVMYPEDYPHCYALIMDSARTLAALTCPHCNKAFARNKDAKMVDEAAATWSIPGQAAK
jgi:hypothetical protein